MDSCFKFTIVNQIFKIIVFFAETFLFCECFKCWFCRKNNCDRFGFLLVCVYQDILNEIACTIEGFQLFISNVYDGDYFFESDVFTVQGFDEVLLSIDDFDGTAWFPFSNITSLEPTVLSERFSGLLITIIVSLCNTWSTKPNFPLRRFIIGKISRI